MSKKKFSLMEKWSKLQLNADIEASYAQSWAKALKAYEKNPRDFFASYSFLWSHPANQVRTPAGDLHSPYSYFDMNLNVMVVKVDPKTKRIATKKNKNWKKNGKGKNPVDEKRNTLTQVWVEWGPWCTPESLAAEAKTSGNWTMNQTVDWGNGMPSHDPRVDTGGNTYEKAIINLAHNIYVLYKDNVDIPNSAKLKNKDRW